MPLLSLLPLPQSWLCGLFMRAWEPASVALGSSRGYETPSSKLLMRATVIVADILGAACGHLGDAWYCLLRMCFPAAFWPGSELCPMTGID